MARLAHCSWCSQNQSLLVQYRVTYILFQLQLGIRLGLGLREEQRSESCMQPLEISHFAKYMCSKSKVLNLCRFCRKGCEVEVGSPHYPFSFYYTWARDQEDRTRNMSFLFFTYVFKVPLNLKHDVIHTLLPYYSSLFPR